LLGFSVDAEGLIREAAAFGSGLADGLVKRSLDSSRSPAQPGNHRLDGVPPAGLDHGTDQVLDHTGVPIPPGAEDAFGSGDQNHRTR
jgi:hypothetical protein